MAAPTNISALTATDLGSLPASVTQTGIHDSGTTYTVYYKHTATITGLLSVFGFGDLVTYQPKTSVLTGPAAAPVAFLITNVGPNRAIQVPVTSGTDYFFKFTPNAGNPNPATLTLTAELLAEQTAPLGSIFVNDDTQGFPAILIGTSGSILQSLHGIVAGEGGDVIDNGTVCLHDGWNNALCIYDTNWNLISTTTGITLASLLGTLRTCQGTQRWWFCESSGGSRTAQYITADATLGTVHTLTAIGSTSAIAANNTETILYHTDSGNTKAVRQWDLVNDVALSDLVAAVTNYQTADILVLSDDTILVSYIKTSSTVDVKVLAYSAAGATLHTYNFGSTQTFPSGTLPRLAYGQDETSFWIWTHPTTGSSKFEEVRVSDGTILTTVTTTEFETGVYQKSVTATPAAYFGNSFSCPFLITRTGLVPPPPSYLNGPAALEYYEAQGLITNFPILRVRRFPHLSDRGQRIFFQRLEILLQAGVGSATTNPTIELRWSNDGGATFTAWRDMNAGKIGEYKYRCFAVQLGMSRDRVFEIRTSDPFFTAWLDADVLLEEGLN